MVATSINHLLSQKCVVQNIESACLLYSTNAVFGEVLFVILTNFLLSVLVYTGPFIISLILFRAKIVNSALKKVRTGSSRQKNILQIGLYGIFCLVCHPMLAAVFVRITLPLVVMGLEVSIPANDTAALFDNLNTLLPKWLDTRQHFILDPVYDLIRIDH